ncbi:MAG TPA: hypothetical protein VMJ32_08975 [Pirellulales bacterium]|nr:hypothetical protein [Pirellulales bacterium]
MKTQKAKHTRRKSSHDMTVAELEQAAAPFEKEFIAEKTRRPNLAQQRLWKKAKRKMGRPKVGAGVQVISVSVEKGLLKQVDNLAKRLRISRARLISDGLKNVIGNCD